MNTVKIGDDFENKSYDLITKALENNELGFLPEHCKILRKQKYYHIIREKDIIFDLAIEVKHPSAVKPTILCIIECKDYSNHKVPVDDLEEFSYKIKGVKGFSVKGIFITNNKFQSGAYKIAENTGIMLIEVDEDNYTIVLHKNERTTSSNEMFNFDKEIKKLIENALLPKKIIGLKKLSSTNIENLANEFLNNFNPDILNYAMPTPLTELCSYLKNEKSISVEFSNIKDNSNNSVLGYFDILNQKILINNSIHNTPQFPFVLAHEIGHFVLHSNLKINQTVYNNFKDVAFNFLQQSFTLNNDKNWIEWQANYFASCLLMPKSSIIARLIAIQKEKGIRNKGTIYLDEQEDNKLFYRDATNLLSTFFGVAKINIEYRLKDLGLVTIPQKNSDEKEKELLRKISQYRKWD